MLKPCVLFLTALLFVFALITPVYATDFEGEWVGHWRNSGGESGRDTLSLHESHHGELKGTWTGNVRVWGKQTGEHSIRLHGKRDDGVSYDITAHGKHGKLDLHYDATRVNGSTYEGWSDLHRRD